MANDDINVLILKKGEERYEFRYTDDQCTEVCKQLGRFAANKELSFSWYDAAVLLGRVRNIQKQAAATRKRF